MESMNGTSGGGDGYGDGSARAYGGGGAYGDGSAHAYSSGGASGVGGRRWCHGRTSGVGGTLPQGVGGSGNSVNGAGGGMARGHQRTFSHGQLVEGGRGHRRAGSKTDFILPAGHEQREREREQQQKKTLTRTTSFPKGHSRQASRTESIYTIRQNKRTLLQKLMFWKKMRERVLRLFILLSFSSPCVCRFANLYFLFIVLLNFVPAVNAFGKEVAMLPLLFVLGITAIKDAFEDRRRYLSDSRVNNATCRVYSSI
ncbi:phospholipid-transporting ATPase VD-like 1 [Homarus americanus]|uniref:Phospholipid-transporting ATPase VD-like 1 n=1 Tax=Homarus americanus TaxID=6706 RepID=A0A8J5K470_HOMAM|nr:phospholipid-transporting ATPase VD-like 1 [Homarus americanus]